MEPYQQRVVGEKLELDDRLTKLMAFVQSNQFKGLPYIEQMLLSQQLGYMASYSWTLGQRIQRFGSE